MQLVANDEKVWEMKAQALMDLNELFPAVKAAKMSVSYNSQWWIGWQTLGRSLLNMGEIKASIVSFQKAVHLNPDCRELWDDDLLQSAKLLQELLQRNSTMSHNELSFYVRECMRIGIT